MRAGEKDAAQIIFCHMLFRFLKGPEYVDELLSPDLACCVPWSYLSSKERSHAPNRCCQLHCHCPWPASLWNCTHISLHEQLHVFTMMKTRRGVKQGLWKCWFRLQNEMKTRWGDSKNEVGLKHFKTRLKRGHSWWKRGHSWWKSAETWKTRLKRGGGTPSIFFTAATS